MIINLRNNLKKRKKMKMAAKYYLPIALPIGEDNET